MGFKSLAQLFKQGVSPMPYRLPRLRRFLVAAFAASTLLAFPLTAAQARVFVGVGFGYPFFAPFYPAYSPAFIYASPPVIYASPPSVVYAPPATYNATSSGRCFAGAYVCPLDRPGPIGAPCSCPTNTTRAAGRIG